MLSIFINKLKIDIQQKQQENYQILNRKIQLANEEARKRENEMKQKQIEIDLANLKLKNEIEKEKILRERGIYVNEQGDVIIKYWDWSLNGNCFTRSDGFKYYVAKPIGSLVLNSNLTITG